MNTCPHCGASIGEHARFCTACMTPLNQKRVISTPKIYEKRWLPVAAAVLVFVLVIGLLWLILPHGENLPTETTPLPDSGHPVQPSGDSAADNTDNPAASGPAGSMSETAAIQGNISTYPSSSGSSPTVGQPTASGKPGIVYIPAPSSKTSGQESGQNTTQRTLVSSSGPTYTAPTGSSNRPTSSSSQSTTTTTTKPTTTTTRPYWQEGKLSTVTEDGLPIEEVTWYYKPIYDKAFHYLTTDIGSYISISKTPSGIPINQCIMVTGFDAPTENGIYRIPAVIDGKVVAAVDFGDSFAQAGLTVKRIYLPPDTVRLSGDLSLCLDLERMYFTGTAAWFHPDLFPKKAPTWWGGQKTYPLTLYTIPEFDPYYIYQMSTPLFYSACRGHGYDVEQNSMWYDVLEPLYGGGGQ